MPIDTRKEYREIWEQLTKDQKQDMRDIAQGKYENTSISTVLLDRNMVYLPEDSNQFKLTDYGKRILDIGTSFESSAIEKVSAERARQDAKWGQQNHEAGKWSLILTEELGEVAKSQLEGDRENYLTELVQAAAVLVAWLECELRKEQ